jgi:hypothetical protein
VIDPNGYDIWEAQLAAVVGNKNAVHYPDFPDDDEELTVVTRIFAATDANKAIFADTEKVRKASE